MYVWTGRLFRDVRRCDGSGSFQSKLISCDSCVRAEHCFSRPRVCTGWQRCLIYWVKKSLLVVEEEKIVSKLLTELVIFCGDSENLFSIFMDGTHYYEPSLL